MNNIYYCLFIFLLLQQQRTQSNPARVEQGNLQSQILFLHSIFINLDKQFCSGNSFEIPAEGRSVTLGGLYSAFQDTFFAGDSLWSAEQINNNKGSLRITKM